MPRVSSRTSAASRMSPSTISTLPLAVAQARFSRRPRTKLSSTTTSRASCATTRSAMCEPIMPAPPVISTRSPRRFRSEDMPSQRAATARSSAPRSSRTTRAGLPAAITPAGIERVTTLPAPTTESLPMVTPLRILRPVADEDVLLEADGGHRRPAAPAAIGMEVVEVRIEDLHVGAQQRARADVDAGALALDVGVVVDLGLVADLDHCLGGRRLQVQVAGVELGRGRPAEAHVAPDRDRAAAEQQHRLVHDPLAGHAAAGRQRAVLPDARELEGVAQAGCAPHGETSTGRRGRGRRGAEGSTRCASSTIVAKAVGKVRRSVSA